MKTKGLVKLLVGLTLAASGAFAVGSGLSHKKAESVDATVTEGKYRINVLTNSANWLQDGVSTLFNPAGSNVMMAKDSDFTQSSTNSNYNSVTLGNDTYNLQTYEFNSKTDLTKNESYWFGRGSNLDGSNWFNTGINFYTQFRSNNYDNTIIISGSWDNFSATTYGWYVKACFHTGLNNASTNYKFMNSAYTPTESDKNIPSGYIFKGWYTDSSLTDEWTPGSQYTDVNLYAKYEVERATGYYIVGDSAFMTEFGTSGTAFDFNSGVLMNSATGSNKAVYTFTTSRTITFKARYYSHENNWWVSNTEMSDSAESHGVTFDASGNYVVPAGTYSLYIFVKNNNDTSSLTYGMPLDSYVVDFLSETAAVCNGDSTVFATLLSTMSNLERNWAKLSTIDQNTLKGTSPNQNGTDNQKVIARYDYILGKYGYGTGDNKLHDFMGRTPAPLSGARSLLPLISNESTNTIAIIVIISLVSVTAVGGYFFIKKRKSI